MELSKWVVSEDFVIDASVNASVRNGSSIEMDETHRRKR